MVGKGPAGVVGALEAVVVAAGGGEPGAGSGGAVGSPMSLSSSACFAGTGGLVSVSMVVTRGGHGREGVVALGIESGKRYLLTTYLYHHPILLQSLHALASHLREPVHHPCHYLPHPRQ